MKHQKKWKSRWLSGVMATLWLLSGCMVDEYTEGLPDSPDSSGEVAVTFTMHLPSAMSSATKGALTPQDENKVETLDLLVFEKGGEQKYRYMVNAEISDQDSGDGNGSDTKTFTFSARLAEGDCDIVVLANARKMIADAGGITSGEAKEDVLASLTLTETQDEQRDHSIPMFGTIGEVTVAEGKSFSVTLVRMISRVNVRVGVETRSTFKLGNIYLYNSYNAGSLAPDLEDFKANDNTKVSAPNIPSVATKRATPVYYTNSDDGYGQAMSDTACVGVIYTFEALQGIEDSPENTLLILAGCYGGSTDTTYYRVDFYHSVKGYLPLLRNHSYEVRIDEVSGPGFPTPDEALNSRPMNIVASVKDWDDAEMDDIFFDGQYYLSRSSGEIKLSREGRTENLPNSNDEWDTSNILYLETDYPEGWKIDSILWANHTDSVKYTKDISKGWLDADWWYGSADVKASVRILVTENESGAVREGEIHLSAGRVNCIVTVTQSDQLNLALLIVDKDGEEISEIIFPGIPVEGYPQEEEEFTVRWAPGSQEVNATMISFAGGYVTLDPASSAPIPEQNWTLNSGGSHTYSFKPVHLDEDIDIGMKSDPFFEKGTRVDFMVSNGNTYVSKPIFLRQIHYNLVCDMESSYLLDGGIHSFKVRSNARWKVSLEDNGNSPEGGGKQVVTRILTQGGQADTQFGYNVEFETVNDLESPSIYVGRATFLFEPADGEEGKFEKKRVTVYCASGDIKTSANSYMAKPGGTGLLIPVSRADEQRELEGEPEAIGANKEYGARLIWQDSPGVIESVKVAGKGRDGYILVMPGETAGNAVVAVTESDDPESEILWSWHIWVTDYDPAKENAVVGETTLMTRNLGATVGDGTIPGRLGLHYQWGRKDPFPVASNTNYSSSTINEQMVYDKEGQDLPVGYIAGPVALEESIRNPLVFYTGRDVNVTNGKQYWWSNTSTRDIWWGDEYTKGFYDPCPEGWKVPSAADLSFAESGNGGTPTALGNTTSMGVRVTNNHFSVDFYYCYFRVGTEGGKLYNSIKTAINASFNTFSGLYWTTTQVPEGSSYYYPESRLALRVETVTTGVISHLSEIDYINGGTNNPFYNIPVNGYSVRCVADKAEPQPD